VARYELTEQARADLVAITDYTVERWGKAQAHAYTDALELCFAKLSRKPLLGRKREDLKADVLSFRAERHVVYYQRQPFGIAILRVLHGRQDTHRHIG